MNESLLTVIEYFGATLSVAGALLVTSQSPKRRLIAFAMWIVADLALVPLFLDKQLPGLVAMQIIYFNLSALGFYNNLRAVRAARKHPPCSH